MLLLNHCVQENEIRPKHILLGIKMSKTNILTYQPKYPYLYPF